MTPGPLTEILRARIAAAGSIPFRNFMEAALYHPEHGYYTSGRARIGRGGDFFTSVSVGPLFGTLLAQQFAEMWERLGRPGEFTIVEQGAHHGDFARDTLAALRALAPACFTATRYHIIEPSPTLRAAQSAALAGFAVQWFPSLDALPAFTGVHFSNELLDAFPVHLVTWDGAAWRETHVALAGDHFAFTDSPITSAPLHAALARLPSVPAGYRTEVNLAALTWLDSLATKLTRGFALIIDYGFPRAEYYRPDRTTGTIAGYAQHRRVADLLAAPGETDLTAHLDFTALAERATTAGLRLAGFTDQHHFIVALSTLHFPGTIPNTAASQRELRAFKTLMHPQMMGRAFHVLAMEKTDTPAPLTGFRFATPALGL
ncbi:MAG: SAM-dependent methyltransferase [Chthoniobacter sp.]|nr:SAM-dependent methyltransferase [Chthoniobacter sp.]